MDEPPRGEELIRLQPHRRRVSVSDLAYESLRDAVIRQRLPAGLLPSEDALAQMLNVSRTPVREALQRLEQDGLLDRSLNGRLLIPQLSTDEAQQLFSVRIALEDLALSEAAEHLNQDVLDEMRMLLEDMQEASLQVRGDVTEGGRGFHKLIQQTANNRINQEILRQLQLKMNRYRFLGTTAANRREQAVKEHQEIYEALSRGSIGLARRLMRHHLEGARASVIEALDVPRSPVLR